MQATNRPYWIAGIISAGTVLAVTAWWIGYPSVTSEQAGAASVSSYRQKVDGYAQLAQNSSHYDERLVQLEQKYLSVNQKLAEQAQTLHGITKLLRGFERNSRPLNQLAPTQSEDVSEAPAASEESQHKARVGRYDAALVTQPVDKDWSGTAESQVMEVLHDHSFDGTRLLDVMCRSTLCRIEVEHPDQAIADRFASKFDLALGWRQSYSHMQFIQGPDGPPRTVVYISREGHSLPER